MTPQKLTRAGRVAILGATNAGKSTLLNAILGQKIAIVTPVVQTTRKRILGVVERGDGQIVLVDTPGLHQHRGVMNKRLMQLALRTLDSVDAVVLLVDVTRKAGFWDPQAAKIAERAKELALPIVLCLNKIDKLAKPALLPMLQKAVELHDFADIIPISARKVDGIELILDKLLSLMPKGEPTFAPGVFTDQNERDICAELIREKANFKLRQELPHSLAVSIESFDESRRDLENGGGLVSVDAVLWVEREGQKPIVVGRGGQMIKAIGIDARQDMEALLDAKVMLRLDVKVAENWSEDAHALSKLGIDED